MESQALFYLLDVQIYALKQKAELLSGGSAIEEKIIDDPPVEDDYIDSTAEIVMPALQPGMTLKQLVSSAPKMPAQISIEDAIQDADAQVAPPTPDVEEQPQPKQEKITIRDRIHEYFDALRNWRMERWRADYEYECKKTAVKEQAKIYDDIIEYVESQIEKLKAADDGSVLPGGGQYQ